jgi:hypothetical protein
MPNIKSLFTDLFIILLKNPAFVKDTDKLIGNIIHDYLNSQECFDLFKDLIINQVFKNYETIIPSLFRLLANYVSGEEQPFLMAQAADVLLNVLELPGIVSTVDETLIREA